MNKRTPSFYRAVCSGIGFAAFRSLSVATSYYSYHGYSKAVNSEGVEALTERLLGTGIGLTESDVNNMISQLTGANNFDVAMEGINAFLLVIIEIAIMVLVYEGFVRKKMWLGTLVSCGVAFTFSFLSMIIGRTAGNIIYDAYVLICALASAWVIWQVFKRYQEALKVGLYTETVYFEKTEEDRMKDLL